MARPFIVGLTGGIASGKSTVSALFQALGVPIIDADQIGRALVTPGSPGLQAVIDQFGPSFLTENGSLNRPALRQQVFANPKARKRLEQILHPLIRASMLEQAEKRPSEPYVVFVIPLLLETGQDRLVDRILVVDCSEQSQLQRLMQRDNLDESLARSMLSSQASSAQRRAIADDLIANETAADKQQLAQRIEQLHLSYLRLSADKIPLRHFASPCKM